MTDCTARCLPVRHDLAQLKRQAKSCYTISPRGCLRCRGIWEISSRENWAGKRQAGAQAGDAPDRIPRRPSV